MDGIIAPIDKICDLAEQYDAMVMVDECHAAGFMGEKGRGSTEYCNAMGRVDIITGTLGKALVVRLEGIPLDVKKLLRCFGNAHVLISSQIRCRQWLFGASIAVIDMLSETTELRDRLEENTKYFREKMGETGFDIIPGDHPITPIMLYDAPLAQNFASRLLEEGVYVIGFFYPVVPKEQARIRVQISAAHTREHLDQAIDAFTNVGKELGVLERAL